jgi:putative hydrolase of the HAD superfamily
VSAPDAFPFDPRRVRAAVFDLGGVLFEGGPSEVRAFGTRVGITPEIWETLRRDVFGNDGTWARLERGECTLDEFVTDLRGRVNGAGGSATIDEAAAFMGVPDPLSRRSVVRDRMIEAVKALHAKMPTALLTNNVREWRASWRGLLPVETLFDVVIDSSEVGARKPEPAIYEITSEYLKVAHADILFVDDIGQNLKAARALGWQTHLFRVEDETLALLGELLAAHAHGNARRAWLGESGTNGRGR